jgi:hypothetical protein
VAESERVGDQRIKSVKNGKPISRTPTLSARLVARFPVSRFPES